MKKIEQIYREILYLKMEKNRDIATQKELSNSLCVSLSTVNHALKPLKKMGSIEVRKRNFIIVNVRKILLYLASIRNIENDIIYETRVERSIREIEKGMPPDMVFTAYSGFKFMYNEVPADYSEVYVYADELKEIKKRFPKNKNKPNLIVLKKDSNMKDLTLANLFADLWNMREWYSREFIKRMEEKLDGILA